MYDGHNDRFVKHGPCEVCGSRDNVAWYESGNGYCFGCGRFYKSRTGFAPRIGRDSSDSISDSGERLVTGAPQPHLIRPLPDDTGSSYSQVVLDWVHQYDLFVPDLLKHNVRWSPRREQLLYIFYGEPNEVVLWQARNFKFGTKHKDRFYTAGTPEKVIATYTPEQGENETAVIVEDCISAIKLSKSGRTGIPCFGSAMSDGKIARLCKMYEKIFVWLDPDKFKEATKISKKIQMLGSNSRVIHTQYDPKEYSIIEINARLK